MSREEFAVYGVPKSARSWAPGKIIAIRSTFEEAERAADEIRWRRKNRPTRIVRQLTESPFTPLQEWRIEA